MANRFFGGVHPQEHKKDACDRPIAPLPAPELVTIAMSQHIGAPCKPLCAVGDLVTIGQKIGDAEGLCAPVHASVSGRVRAIAPRPHCSGGEVLSVVIENDGNNTLCPTLQRRDSVEGLSPETLTALLREAGVVGMGGAMFPTHAKIASGIGKVDTVLVNAAECEPYITADDRLLREQPERVIGGLRVILHIFGLTQATICIESNKAAALERLRALLRGCGDISLRVLKTRYPQGAEKQLIQSVTGCFVPPGGLPAQVGCAVFNAATCAAIYDAVYEGMPLVRRVVTVTGGAIQSPSNFLVPLGVSFRTLIDAAGGFCEEPYKILSGGPMMGLAQASCEVSVLKGTNAITCLTRRDALPARPPHCIRCGRCVRVCPMRLMPLELYRAERGDRLSELRRLNAADCVECGACAYGCPARLPLVQSMKTAKQKLRDEDAARRAKEAAKC